MDYERGMVNLLNSLLAAGTKSDSEELLDFYGWRRQLLESIQRERRYAGLGPQERELRETILRNLERLSIKVTSRSLVEHCTVNTLPSVTNETPQKVSATPGIILALRPMQSSQLPNTRIVAPNERLVRDCDIDVSAFTTNAQELMAVLQLMVPLPRQKQIVRTFRGTTTHYLGLFGKQRIAVSVSRQGSIEPNSIRTIVSDSIRYWRPRVVLLMGVCLGGHPHRQQMGDVLIATHCISYEPLRLGPDNAIPRGAQTPVDPTLLNRFSVGDQWDFRRPDGSACQVEFGPLLSGEKLIDNIEVKRMLFDAFPQAIGGEMEGAGFAAVALERKIPWMIVKGISDWGDGTKSNEFQPLASAAAASYCRHVLAQPTVLAPFPKPAVSQFE